MYFDASSFKSLCLPPLGRSVSLLVVTAIKHRFFSYLFVLILLICGLTCTELSTIDQNSGMRVIKGLRTL